MTRVDNTSGKVGYSFRQIADNVITVWALLLGGALVVCVVLVNVASVLGGIFWKPFPGDFELTEMGIAVAAFAFLPYCQLKGANVTADIFTSNSSPEWIAFFKLVASFVALGFACLLLWSMYQGLLSRYQYGYQTAILQIPMWIAYVPILFSWILLILAAAISIGEALQSIFQR